MSVPPQQIQQALGGKGAIPPGAPPPPGAKPPVPGPAGGPMMTPGPKEGNLAGARADIQVSIKKLTQTLNTFAPTTDEGAAIMKAVGILSKAFGETEGKDKELMPAEIMQAVSGLAGPGKPPAGLPSPAGPAPLPTPM
jgi:hypothetical protein